MSGLPYLHPSPVTKDRGTMTEFERVLLAMVLADPAVLARLSDELFDEPGHRQVLYAMRSLADRGVHLAVDAVRAEAGDCALWVPEPWFTTVNAPFLIKALEDRLACRLRRAALRDELAALGEE